MLKQYPLEYFTINRLYNTHILNRVEKFENVAKDLLGVQAQIPNASAIAYAIRINNPEYVNYLRAFESMKLIRIWGIRTTLHSYCFDDWNIILSQVVNVETWFSKKLKKQGIQVENLIKQAIDILSEVDYFDRDYLIKGGIPKKYLGSWGDLLIELNNRGYICNSVNGNWGEKRVYKNTKKYFEKIRRQDFQINEKKKQYIAIRYFSAYGPATIRDFAHWLGVSIGQANNYINTIKEKLKTIIYENQYYYILHSDYKRCEEVYYKFRATNQCWLLPKFDPLLLAYEDKQWISEKNYQKYIWKIAGHVEGVVVQNWKAIAIWKYTLDKETIKFDIVLFDKQYPINKESLDERCSEIANFRKYRIKTITIR